jgi:hypothetical protein
MRDLVAAACAGFAWIARGIVVSDGRSRIEECVRRTSIVALTSFAIIFILFVLALSQMD